MSTIVNVLVFQSTRRGFVPQNQRAKYLGKDAPDPLPPYSPELSPVERLWNSLRRDYCANRVFDSLKSAIDQAETGLAKMAANRSAVRSLTNCPWIRVILNAI